MSHIADLEIRKRLLCSDQIALAQIFSPVVNEFNLKYAHLSEHWNWRGGNSNRACAEDVVIDHHPDIRNNTFNQLADCAFGLLISGDVAKSALYCNVAISALDPDITKLSTAQHIEKLIGIDVLREFAIRLRGRDFNSQSASLLLVALFHQRTLQDLSKARSILEQLATSLQ